ncbi:MAG: hypothetical protein ACLTEZ_09200 [Ruthenibacterium lactatiformans]|uniref:Uncharacterized protein n=1 Tax=Ruthenibacterium lactatiformans TaxID=1550024 RepID=A0A6I2UBX3_9FIRM|nr:hypothetical protein [Ruthenibacterium lactatiformans]MCI6597403.1 hypothetical protein [Ruthenibacterium lactatiformans]MST92901.1 hypothetical protein [Ruthenibacterium lactatiformans]
MVYDTLCHKPNHIEYDFGHLFFRPFPVFPNLPQIRRLGRVSKHAQKKTLANLAGAILFSESSFCFLNFTEGAVAKDKVQFTRRTMLAKMGVKSLSILSDCLGLDSYLVY